MRRIGNGEMEVQLCKSQTAAVEVPLSSYREGDTEIFRLTNPVTDSNCYVIRGENSGIIIDPNNAEALEYLLQKWNIRPSLVLLTHGHCDHVSGLNELRKAYPVTVVSTVSCSEEMQDARENMSRRMEVFLYYKSGETKRVSYPPFICEPADRTFDGELRIPFEKTEITMRGLPGHTRGSSVIEYQGLLFCGDYLLPGEKVITRMPGGNEEDYERETKPWLRNIPDGTRLFPGHGDPFVMCEEVRIWHEL